MGIKLLNKFLREKCSSAINEISLNELRGEKIVIDISIYLYKFKGNNELIPSIYLMCSLFHKYGIQAIFIFDGKPPINKNRTIENRKEKKQEAYNKFLELQKKLKETMNLNTKRKIKKDIADLRKQCTRVSQKNTELVKNLLSYYGFSYIHATGEADALCAQLVLNNQAYACLSEDTDLFVYGCTRVLRYFSFMKESIVLYDFPKILKILKLNKQQFQILCILSGTDYNQANRNIFYHYKILDFEKNNINFYKNYKNLYNIIQLFNIPTQIKQIPQQSSILKKKLRDLLTNNNFLFIT